ncbi:MAG: amidohydrolase [Pseudolabrys sp.]|nr:amidohydrolase [Pseudolabrys sp.]MCW5686063.1 amidohydrolase [Pseudolabrys sp.]
MVRKIALEEHFIDPATFDYWRPTMSEVPAPFVEKLIAALSDFGEQRLKLMDECGLAHCVLAASGPGVQAERDTATAIRNARASNDFLGKEVTKRPDRYSGFAHLPMQDAKAAADELERCMRDYKFRGAMINGQTHGRYLDDPALYPFWERAEALGAVVYLHPADPEAVYPALAGYKSLQRATWGWGVETGSHALRLVFSGLFDRFPKAKFALGHTGETLPFLLWRFDSRAKLYNVKLGREPSQYIKDNIWVTISGMYSKEPLDCALAALGRDRVMFSADFPFEDAREACHFMDTVPLDEGVRADVAFNNAAKLLGV